MPSRDSGEACPPPPCRGELREPAVASDQTASANENAPNSAGASQQSFAGEVTINTRWNKRLPWRFQPEILIGTQNASPEGVTDDETTT